MKVQDVMSKEVGFCHSSDNLTKAVDIMWHKDCGVVPVVDDHNVVVGMITDRDISIAVGTQDRKAAEIKAGEFCGGEVIAVDADDDLKDVLKKMRKNRIRRLPVTSQTGELLGIISLNDLLLKTDENKKLTKKIVSTLIEIGKPRPILLREVE